MVGTEHSWLQAFEVWADLSTAAVPFELVDNYTRENGNGKGTQLPYIQQCTIGHTKPYN